MYYQSFQISRRCIHHFVDENSLDIEYSLNPNFKNNIYSINKHEAMTEINLLKIREEQPIDKVFIRITYKNSTSNYTDLNKILDLNKNQFDLFNMALPNFNLPAEYNLVKNTEEIKLITMIEIRIFFNFNQELFNKYLLIDKITERTCSKECPKYFKDYEKIRENQAKGVIFNISNYPEIFIETETNY